MNGNKDIDVQLVNLPRGSFPRRRQWCLNCDTEIQRGFFCTLECANTHFLVRNLERCLETQFPKTYELKREKALRRILAQ